MADSPSFQFQDIESVVRTFMQKQSIVQMRVEEALEGFWRAKNGGTAEYLEDYSRPQISCYILLPGGSCFGNDPSLSVGKTSEDIREEVAKIALMNSLYNEHPSRKITPEYIQQTLRNCRISHGFFGSSFDGLKSTLDFMRGRSFMEMQELNNNLKLLHWAGRSADLSFSTRNEYLEYASGLKVTERLRMELALELLEREQECCGYLEEEVRQARKELQYGRKSFQEIRFPFEKEKICVMALQQLENDYGQESLAV